MLKTFVAIALVSIPFAGFAGEAGPKIYRPIQAITYSFGSKNMVAYFVQDAARCHVIAMIGERPNLDGRSTATRVRLILAPGQAERFDSEEGESLNLTCGESGATVAVECSKMEARWTRDHGIDNEQAEDREGVNE